jgi:hypothetical protein
MLISSDEQLGAVIPALYTHGRTILLKLVPFVFIITGSSFFRYFIASDSHAWYLCRAS